MNDRTQQVLRFVHDRSVAVLIAAVIAVTVGTISAVTGRFAPSGAGRFAGLAWFCAASYLRYWTHLRDEIPYSVTSIFYGFAAGLWASSIVGLTDFQVHLVQTSAYVTLALLGVLAGAVVIYGVSGNDKRIEMEKRKE